MSSNHGAAFSPGLERLPAQKWTPPPEPHKPHLPYRRGLNLKIRRHKPASPFGLEYASYDGERKEVGQSQLLETTVADLCHAYPPIEGATVEDDYRELEIIEPLEVKDGHGAQVFVCRLGLEPKEYAAKVYDPLYYGFQDLMWSDLPRDVTYAADGDYSREVAAYEYLGQQSFQGPEIPVFHGSWTFDLPTDECYRDPRTGKTTRPVRMILIEYVNGKTMLEINVARTPVEHRLSVLTRAMEAESRLSFIGLDHNDVTQRNILVCGYESTSQPPTRVCLFDFNIAVVRQRSKDVVEKGIVPEKTKLPVSPVDLWWHAGVFEFGNWLPEDWVDQSKEWRRWMFQQYAGSTDFELPVRSQEHETEMDLHADAEPYNDPSDVWKPTYNAGSFSPGANLEFSDDKQFDHTFAHTSPKRSWGDFQDDGAEPAGELWDSFKQEQRLLGHLSIGVKDYDIAKSFFLAFRPLGMHLVYDSEAAEPGSGIRTLGYGPDKTQELLNIFEYGDEAQPPGRGSHVAFNAPSREAVDEFYKEALVYGGTCDGKPGLRARYGPYYYAAFVISPDGWRLEAVCKKPD
ncbi:hypothetical protein NKR19_g4617 [Coniochaeta hoffmannii]|uniref:VOC domain-containing protein n=1 Tax=Coniochaeta hoffmannii TaxID=91930 RepID=A0AA38RPW8_9PEZI|nr:hypothetical protein NKR19_g4617 [Coniochaeta hoffmannii]